MMVCYSADQIRLKPVPSLTRWQIPFGTHLDPRTRARGFLDTGRSTLAGPCRLDSLATRRANLKAKSNMSVALQSRELDQLTTLRYDPIKRTDAGSRLTPTTNAYIKADFCMAS